VGSEALPTFGACRQSILAVKKLTVCSKFDRIASQTPPVLCHVGGKLLDFVWFCRPVFPFRVSKIAFAVFGSISMTTLVPG
jgi:hypothetical protein